MVSLVPGGKLKPLNAMWISSQKVSRVFRASSDHSHLSGSSLLRAAMRSLNSARSAISLRIDQTGPFGYANASAPVRLGLLRRNSNNSSTLSFINVARLGSACPFVICHCIYEFTSRTQDFTLSISFRSSNTGVAPLYVSMTIVFWLVLLTGVEVDSWSVAAVAAPVAEIGFGAGIL